MFTTTPQSIALTITPRGNPIYSGDENFKDQEGREKPSAIDDQHLKTIVEHKPHQSVREMSQAMGASILTILDHL